MTVPSLQLEGRDLKLDQLFGLYKYAPDTLKNVTVHRGVIGQEAFCDVSSLEKVILGKGVTLVRNSAFMRCTSLKELTVMNPKLEAFYIGALLGCQNLTDIYFCGTVDEWNAIKKANLWIDNDLTKYALHCNYTNE